jgi:2'-5' RNA ligase
MHLTLRFFGETSSGQIPEIEALMRRAAQRMPFEVSFGTVGAFDSWDNPKVVWIGVDKGAAELAALAGAFGASEGARPYFAHLTIGRRRSRSGQERLREAACQANFIESRQIVDKVVLFESCRTQRGQIYLALKEVLLGG